jgi:hypothetical protein
MRAGAEGLFGQGDLHEAPATNQYHGQVKRQDDSVDRLEDPNVERTTNQPERVPEIGFF